MSEPKVLVTITNRAPGLQPPVYVAGSFSNPQWVPEPMEYTTAEDGVHTFTKTLEVEPESKIVYKFRVGEGDWWLLNEDAPTVMDAAGNRNNILDAPKAPVPGEDASPHESAIEPTQTSGDERTEHTTEDMPQPNTTIEVEQPKPLSHADRLKTSEEAGQARTSTPEFIKTITEVAESAALLDRATPEPESQETTTGTAGKEEQLPSTTLLPGAADTAAEVADSTALLDCSTPEPEALKSEDVPVQDKDSPSEVAAQVTDTAEKLDNDKSMEALSEVTAVADTAETLDTHDDESESYTKAPSSAYKTVADIKADMRDESLDIAGYSNDLDPVPLFAHECAGLYEDDEIPGVDEETQSSYNGRFFKDDKEDYNDPTLERFPSTRDGIMSTVRKVESGLNVDQVSVAGAPLSPVVPAPGSPIVESCSELATSDASPTSRDSQHLPVSLSLAYADDLSASVNSLQSIAEDAEGAEEDEVAHEVQRGQTDELDYSTKDLPSVADIPVKNIASIAELPSKVQVPPAAQDIASVVEQTGGDDATLGKELDTEDLKNDEVKEVDPMGTGLETGDGNAKQTDEETSVPAPQSYLEPLVMVPSPSVKPNTSLLSPVSDDDEAVVVKNPKDKGEDNTKSGYLTSEQATTRQPEESGSPCETAPNTADPAPKQDLECGSPMTDTAAALPVPRSPSTVVSKPNETPPEELLPVACLPESSSQEAEPQENSKVPGDEGLFRDIEDAESLAVVKTSKDDGAEAVQASQDGEASGSFTTPSAANGSHGTSSQGDGAARTSATDDSQTGGLKQRAVDRLDRPDPTDRSATPKSITSPHKKATGKGGNWLSSFLRFIFIDFVGGIVRKLTGGGRKTLVTAVVVLVAAGYISVSRTPSYRNNSGSW